MKFKQFFFFKFYQNRGYYLFFRSALPSFGFDGFLQNTKQTLSHGFCKGGLHELLKFLKPFINFLNFMYILYISFKII